MNWIALRGRSPRQLFRPASMNTKLSLPILVLCASAAFVNGQVATDSGLQSSQPRTTPPPAAAPQPNLPERAQIDEIFKQTSLGQEADERRLHIEWRQLQNQIINEPDIVAAKRSAESARTDLEKRQRLRDYYDLYYGRMRVLARSGEMKTALDRLKIAHLSQLTQARVRHETDTGLPTPSPTPKKKGKDKHTRKFQNAG